MKSLKNKNILICITGSIAVFKSCEIIRLLKKEGAKVQSMLSESATQFVGPATFAALTGEEVLTDLFNKNPKPGLEHIKMAFELDAIVVVPATANILCKTASGIADDIISTTLSVCQQPTIFVPAMNNRMWENFATQEAVKKLKKRNFNVMDPEDGLLASLHSGKGRLPNIKSIINQIRLIFNIPQPLKGKKVLVTAGPTRENIDPVRFISNRSSGKMGYALAETAYKMGAEVILISGPVSLPKPTGIKLISVETALQMQQSCLSNSKKADYIFMAAAVSDYKAKIIYQNKYKSSPKTFTLDLIPTCDILKSISLNTNAKIIGFALETNNGKKNALKKLKNKNADYIVLNYANEDGAGFDANTNRVIIYSKNKQFLKLPKEHKTLIAHKIIKFIIS